MKKITKFVIILAILTSSIFSYVLASTYTKFSSKFVKNFKDCDKYEETITSDFDGETFVTNRKIIGWRNGFCRYNETIKSPQSEYILNCNFSDIQVEELYKAMKNKSNTAETYNLETFVKRIDPKTKQEKFVSNGTSSIKGNKAFIVWAKYQNNPYTCLPTKVK